jgi:uncharacterized protein
MEIAQTLADELGLRLEQVEATLSLLKEGNTVPFIARYRKEVTGSLDDVTLRKLTERLDYLNSLEERRQSILSSIQEQGKLTPDLQAQIGAASKLTELENLYRPYKKKRKTKGSMAIDAGLQPLADFLLKQQGNEAELHELAQKSINPEKGIANVEDALQGAKDILAEKFADVASFYEEATAYINKTGRLESKETKEDVEKTLCQLRRFRLPGEEHQELSGLSPQSGRERERLKRALRL